jgi:uncharacterized protein (TIGR01777 family)
MTIAITGASGLVGRHAAELLRREGHEIRAISTRGAVRSQDLDGCNAVVNLAGEPVAQRWSKKARERIRSSRMDGTSRLVVALAELKNRPAVLVNASAVGYYGNRGDELLNESALPSQDFLGELTVGWEREAGAAEKLGIRVVRLRLGVVLARDGGALAKMLTPFKLGVGGRIGSGQQWMSWIHIDDVARLIAFAIANSSVNGPVNAVAPNPVRNGGFTNELAAALHRPAIFPVPIFALKLMFGQMSEILYASQRAVPDAALQMGFRFNFPELGPALRNLL